jgi:hypothetical protein
MQRLRLLVSGDAALTTLERHETSFALLGELALLLGLDAPLNVIEF